jgi:hypothetical protein
MLEITQPSTQAQVKRSVKTTKLFHFAAWRLKWVRIWDMKQRGCRSE